MSGKEKRWRAPSATPWDDATDDELTGAERIVRDSQRSIYAFRHAPDRGDAAFFNAYPPTGCPRCGGPPQRNGHRPDGLQRYLCRRCGQSFTSVTGTIFDGGKLPVAAWGDFILQALSFESMAAMTREDRRSSTTTSYWMEKLFLVLEGVQDDVVLSGDVWIDEAYWPVEAKDAVLRADGSLPSGLSRNQICIAIATDGKSTVFVESGRGKPSRKRIWDALGAHIAPGSTIIHDMERSHDVLIERLGLKSKRCNASLLKGLSDDLNPLEPVNRMCFYVKTMLRAHSSFDRSKTQGYLDLLAVALNPPKSKLEKVAFVLDRAMRCPKSLTYRDWSIRSPS